jgi:hypothetical protein
MRLYRVVVDNYLEPMDPAPHTENVHTHRIEGGILVLIGVGFTQYVKLGETDFATVSAQDL